MVSFDKYELLDPNFVDDLERSKEAVCAVAEWLTKQGKNVEVNPIYVRPSVEKMALYSDKGDINLIEGDSKRIEVKRRETLYFTSANDFPYKTIIVDVAHAWDKANPKPSTYYILNKKMSHCCVVPGDTSGKWKKVHKRDRFKHRFRTFYECPIELCKFMEINRGE